MTLLARPLRIHDDRHTVGTSASKKSITKNSLTIYLLSRNPWAGVVGVAVAGDFEASGGKVA